MKLEELTLENIDAFVGELREMVESQSLAFMNLPLNQRDFDREAIKALFVKHGFDQEWQWLGVDFDEADPSLFLSQLEHADDDQLGTWRMLVEKDRIKYLQEPFDRSNYVSAKRDPKLSELTLEDLEAKYNFGEED